jgi:hypothetical protein
MFDDQSRGLRELLDSSVPHMLEIHPTLGWRYAPNFKNATNQLNSRALRSSREYAPTPPPGVLRIAAFGDSYVYGSEVENRDGWTAIMESEDPRLEVLNYGVGGYGVDQAYLRYLLEGAALRPHVVVMGFTKDDLGRVVNVYRPFIDSRDVGLFKPRFLLDGGNELFLLEPPARSRPDYERLLANPREVLRHVQHEYWYRRGVYENPLYDYSATVRFAIGLWTRAYRRSFDPEGLFKGQVFNTASSAFRIHVALFRAFAKAVRSAGALPVVLMLPDPTSVAAARNGKPTAYEPLLTPLREHDVPHLDAASAFQAEPTNSDATNWFAPHGHYSPAGNRIVATWLRVTIRELAAAEGVFQSEQ